MAADSVDSVRFFHPHWLSRVVPPTANPENPTPERLVVSWSYQADMKDHQAGLAAPGRYLPTLDRSPSIPSW